MTFKPIETQEELNSIIQERLNREKKSYEAKLTGLEDQKAQLEKLQEENTSLQKALEDAKGKDQTIEELQGKVKNYELSDLRTKVALKNGLDYTLASRLVGNTEEELQADAETLASQLAPQTPHAPLKSTEPEGEGGVNSAYRQMLKGLN